MSHSDYEQIAAGLPDIKKSSIRTISEKRRKTLLLSVAGLTPDALEQDQSILASLADRVEQLSLAPRTPLYILPATLKPFYLSATLTVQEKLSTDQKADIARTVFETLRKATGYQTARIGEPITTRNIQYLISFLTFIRNVDITALHFADRPPAVSDLIPAISSSEPTTGEDLIYLAAKGEALTLRIKDDASEAPLLFTFPGTCTRQEDKTPC